MQLHLEIKIINYLLVLALLGSSLIFSSCANNSENGGEKIFGYLGNTTSRYPIVVRSGRRDISVPIYENYGGISKEQMKQVNSYFNQFNSDSGSRLEILVPRGSYNEVVAARSSERLIELAKQNGIQASSIMYGGYPADGRANAPIKMSYKRYKAYAKNCVGMQRNIEGDSLNTKYQSFGCSTQYNLAQMVANPRDLVMPSGYGPPSYEKSYEVYKKYVQEQPTNDNEGSQNQKVSSIGGK